MNRSTPSFLVLSLALLPWLLTGCVQIPVHETSVRPFDFQRDRFAFSNETVWNYAGGEVQKEATDNGDKNRQYSRRCFVVSRAVVQFWKFARFDADAAPLTDDQLAGRIRQVTGIDVWEEPYSQNRRIVMPGYASLHAMSLAHKTVFQDNIGLGWPTYFRPGNMCIVFPPGRAHQQKVQTQIQKEVASGYPQLLWLVNFPSLSINHAVVAFAVNKTGSKITYTVYDPNYADAPKTLEYDPEAKSFYYQPTFYFKGGRVDVRVIYLGVFQ